jgi:hypothetical protein
VLEMSPKKTEANPAVPLEKVTHSPL